MLTTSTPLNFTVVQVTLTRSLHFEGLVCWEKWMHVVGVPRRHKAEAPGALAVAESVQLIIVDTRCSRTRPESGVESR